MPLLHLWSWGGAFTQAVGTAEGDSDWWQRHWLFDIRGGLPGNHQKTVTNIVRCDGNDRNIQMFHAVLLQMSSHCTQNRRIQKIHSNTQHLVVMENHYNLPLCRWFDLMIFSEYSDMLEHSICRQKKKTKCLVASEQPTFDIFPFYKMHENKQKMQKCV